MPGQVFLFNFGFWVGVDTIVTFIVLRKLEYLRIRENQIKLFQDYLPNRLQHVKVSHPIIILKSPLVFRKAFLDSYRIFKLTIFSFF